MDAPHAELERVDSVWLTRRLSVTAQFGILAIDRFAEGGSAARRTSAVAPDGATRGGGSVADAVAAAATVGARPRREFKAKYALPRVESSEGDGATASAPLRAFRFVSGFFRDVLYQRTLNAQRLRMHRTCAEWLGRWVAAAETSARGTVTTGVLEGAKQL